MEPSKSRKSKRSRNDTRTSSSSSRRRRRRTRTESSKTKEKDDSNLGKFMFPVGVAIAGRQGSKLVDNWSGFFGETIKTATKPVTDYVSSLGLWEKLANGVVEGGDTKSVTEVIAAMPEALGKQMQRLCSEPKACADKISPQTLGYLAIIGVPLSVYLYVKFRGTEHEKKVLERELRRAKRISEEETEYDYILSNRRK